LHVGTSPRVPELAQGKAARLTRRDPMSRRRHDDRAGSGGVARAGCLLISVGENQCRARRNRTAPRGMPRQK
jgi:hypothetical protein